MTWWPAAQGKATGSGKKFEGKFGASMPIRARAGYPKIAVQYLRRAEGIPEEGTRPGKVVRGRGEGALNQRVEGLRVRQHPRHRAEREGQKRLEHLRRPTDDRPRWRVQDGSAAEGEDPVSLACTRLKPAHGGRPFYWVRGYSRKYYDLIPGAVSPAFSSAMRLSILRSYVLNNTKVSSLAISTFFETSLIANSARLSALMSWPAFVL